MTKPVLFRLTKTMVKLIKVYYINTLEIGGGGGGCLPPLFMHLVYSIISNFTPHRLLT